MGVSMDLAYVYIVYDPVTLDYIRNHNFEFRGSTSCGVNWRNYED